MSDLTQQVTQVVLSGPAEIVTTLAAPAPIVTTLTAGQGPAGPQGIPGASGASYLTYKASGAVSGHRAVRAIGGGLLGYADSNTVAHANSVLGISMNAASNGNDVNVQFSGEMVEPSWNWTPGLPVFCGVQGVLTQTPPSVGFQLVVAVAISATAVIVGIKFPIIK
jgi:hypothetical protein